MSKAKKLEDLRIDNELENIIQKFQEQSIGNKSANEPSKNEQVEQDGGKYYKKYMKYKNKYVNQSSM